MFIRIDSPHTFPHFTHTCLNRLGKECTYVIQIKFCAEYWDMLPRPRLVCQEPGLRPIGRSPGVPDKSNRGLRSMSRYSAQILICFIAYIFQFLFLPLWVWLGTLQVCEYPQCPLPLSIVIRMRLVIRQSKLPACLAEVQLAHQNSLLHLCHRPVKSTDKWMKSVSSMGSFQYKNQVNGESFAYMWVILLYFSLESRLIPAVLELGQVRLLWKLTRSRIWELSHGCQTGVWKYFPNSLALK